VARVAEIDGSATRLVSCRSNRTYLGHWALCGGSVSGHLVPEWVLGRGFFDTEAEGGPRGATEKKIALFGEASWAILQAGPSATLFGQPMTPPR
jgi:hypothetical protein